MSERASRFAAACTLGVGGRIVQALVALSLAATAGSLATTSVIGTAVLGVLAVAVAVMSAVGFCPASLILGRREPNHEYPDATKIVALDRRL